MIKAIDAKRAKALLIAPELRTVAADNGEIYVPQYSILTAESVLFDAVYVPGGERATAWLSEVDAIDFMREAYKHCKPVAATGEGVELLKAADIPVGGPHDPISADAATIVAQRASPRVARRFMEAMALHRLWDREAGVHLPL